MTLVRHAQWDFGVRSVLVEVCWTQSYFCSLKARSPVEEERAKMYEMMQFKHKRHTKSFAPFRDRNSMGEILKSFSTKECFGIKGSASVFPETLNMKT